MKPLVQIRVLKYQIVIFFASRIIVEKIKQGKNNRPFPTPGIEPGPRR